MDITVYGGYNKIDFLKAVQIVAQATIGFAHRFANLAKELAEKETDPAKKRRIASNSEKLLKCPENPCSDILGRSTGNLVYPPSNSDWK